MLDNMAQTAREATSTGPEIRAVLAMTISHVVDDLYQGAVPAIIPFLISLRHYDYLAVAGITLAATFLSSVAQPVFGVLADRQRTTWLMPAGLVLAGGGIGLCGVVDNYAWTWSAVALSGLGVAAYHPEASRVARASARGSARGMSWFAVGGNVGFALGPVVVTPALLGFGLSFTPILAAPAILSALALVVRRRGARPTGGGGTAPAGSDQWRPFAWLTAAVICRSICFFGVSSFLAAYVTRNLGGSAVAGSTALTVLLAVGAAGTLLGGWLADRYGRLMPVRLGYTLTGPGLLGVLLSPSPPSAIASAALLGIGLYLPFSVHVTLGQEYLPNRVGTASGVTLGLAVSVGGIFSPALGALADRTSIATAMATLFVLPVVALSISTRLPEPGPPRRTSYTRPGGGRSWTRSGPGCRTPVRDIGRPALHTAGKSRPSRCDLSEADEDR
jgi:FSR family fosmidomycin resistance protein-like MFS transporter